MAKSSVPDELAKPPLRNIWNDAMGDLSGSQFKAIEKAFKKDLLPKALDAWPEAFPDPGQMKAKMRAIESAIKEIQKAIKDTSGLDDKGKKVLNKALVDVGKELEKREKVADELLKPKPPVVVKLELKVDADKCKSYALLEGVAEGKSLVAGGKFYLFTDLKTPVEVGKDAPDKKKIEAAGEARVKELEERLTEAVNEALESLAQFKKDDDYKGAKDCVDKVNKFAEELLEDTPAEIREAVGKKLGISADEFETVNNLTMKKLVIPRGVFKSDKAGLLEDPPDLSGLVSSLWPKMESVKKGSSSETPSKDLMLADEKEVNYLLLMKDKDNVVLLLEEGKKPKNDWRKYFSAVPEQFEGVLTTVKHDKDKILTVTRGRLTSDSKKAMEKAIENQMEKGIELK